eukprot:m.385109 g.385109  ORF g.385109 m.385109 type:complete len:395 (-) comp21003_c0_seq4:781-1965(-)
MPASLRSFTMTTFVVAGLGGERCKDDPMKWQDIVGSNALVVYKLDEASKGLTLTTSAPVSAGINPMALACANIGDKSFVYASDMAVDDPAIRVFALHRETGALTPCGRTSTSGKDPCHLFVHTAGTKHFLFAAHYGSGSVAMHEISADGSIQQASDTALHSTDGMPRTHGRQELPHPHGVFVRGDFLYVPDLGKNAIFVYKINFLDKKLALVQEKELSVDGSGPRHLAFLGSRAYSVNELNNTVTVFDVDTDTGMLSEIVNASTLPKGWDAPPPFDFYDAPSHACGIIAIEGSNRIIVTNRGHDSLAVFDVQDDGQLSLSANVPTMGRIPWTVDAVPSKNLLVVTNQFNHALKDPGNIALFDLAGDAGVPKFTGTPGFVTHAKVMCATCITTNA